MPLSSQPASTLNKIPFPFSVYRAQSLLYMQASKLKSRECFISLLTVIGSGKVHVTTANPMRRPLKTFYRKLLEVSNSYADCLRPEGQIGLDHQ